LDNKLKSYELVAKQSSFERLNDQLTKCRCYVMAIGKNGNYTNIPKEAVDDAMDSIKNIPVVAHLKKSGDIWTVGGHDSKWEWDEDDNLNIIDLTVPYGVVPENCNPTYEDVLEEDGLTTNTYLCVDIYLWTGRYNIMDAAFNEDIYFSQSMEIMVDQYCDDEEDPKYEKILKYHYSALCLLGKSDIAKHNVRPCFPSSRVERLKYSLDESKFKQDFAELMKEVREFSLQADKSDNGDYSDNLGQEPKSDETALNNNADSNTDTNEPETHSETDNVDESQSKNTLETESENFNKEEENLKDTKDKFEILFSDVSDKINVLMSEQTFMTKHNERYEKYMVLHIDEAGKYAVVADRESGYTEGKYLAHKVPYMASQTSEGLSVNLDFEAKEDWVIGAVPKTDAVFEVSGEVKMFTDDTCEFRLGVHTTERINDLTGVIAKHEAKIAEYEARIPELEKQIGLYEKDKEAYMKQKHKDLIDTVIAGHREEMGKFSDYMEYCLSVDYTKTVEEHEKALKEIRYNFLDKNSTKNKTNFSAIETSVAGGGSESISVIAEQYGEDMAKFFN
jgi:hypothetical protein